LVTFASPGKNPGNRFEPYFVGFSEENGPDHGILPGILTYDDQLFVGADFGNRKPPACCQQTGQIRASTSAHPWSVSRFKLEQRHAEIRKTLVQQERHARRETNSSRATEEAGV
jgi:hypothetical protein